ncbi:MAG: hypothetical protein WA952_14580 [Lewinella sp.]
MRTLSFISLVSLLLLLACTEEPSGPGDSGQKTTAADSIEAEPPQYVIRQSRFYHLVPGEPLADADDRLERSIMNDGEGSFTIYRIRGEEGEEIGFVVPSVNDSLLIGDIHVTTPTAATEGDIRVGHRFARLRIAYPKVEVKGSEIEGRTYAYTRNKAFRLKGYTSTEQEIDKEEVPADIRISEIIIMEQVRSAPLEI